jgi:electron transport complex protein RnfA
MQTITFVVTLIITYLIIEIIVYNFWKKTHEKLSIYLKSSTTNCAILGVLLINSQINPFTNQPFSLLENMVSSISNGIGFTIALLLITGVQKRLQFSQIPKPLQNIPVAFLSAGLISMVLLGFSNINFSMLFGG